jgi:small-conductance mechanosensitive channel
MCNLFGRVSLAKIMSVSAIYGLSHIIGLTIFIQIILEAVHLQTLVNKLKGGLVAKLNFIRVEKLVRLLLLLVVITVWCMVFLVSMNLFNGVYDWLLDLLTRPRKLGTTDFQLGNILLFLFIIYLSNLFQQGVGSLYSRTESAWDPEVKKNASRLAITRLLLIVCGFLLAVAASGLPMDKITIVLGALGVGIGLGLQTIVNNLVSGVILIFEQPFRIGDFIELGDKRGRVLDIGIRSSKIMMEEGAEIIMPNADLLSGRVINWTLHNDNIRIEMDLSVSSEHSLQEITGWINEELLASENVMRNMPPEILLANISEKSMQLRILVWIDNVHKTQFIRSQLLSRLNDCLDRNGVKIV